MFSFLLEIVLLLDVFYCAYLWAKISAFLGKLLLLSNMLYNFTATYLYFLYIQQYVSLAFNMFCVLLYHTCFVIQTLVWVLTRTVRKQGSNVT